MILQLARIVNVNYGGFSGEERVQLSNGWENWGLADPPVVEVVNQGKVSSFFSNGKC